MMLWQSIWFYFCVSFWKRGLLKSNFHSFRLLNIIRTTCWFFSLSKYVNTTYDVMAVLVFGFTSFYQYWLLILLQYQSPWANKTHTFNLLLLRKGGWLVGCCPKKNQRKEDWFGRMQFFIGANSLLLGEMSLSKKEKLVVLPTSYSGSSLLEEGLLECKTLWLLTFFELPKGSVSSSLLHPFWHEKKW